MQFDAEAIIRGAVSDARVLIVVAHPDDEVIGAGARLARLPGLSVVLVTDGAPRDMNDARRNGFQTRQDYAAARHRELERALIEGNARPELICLGIPDQEATVNLLAISLQLIDLIGERRPRLILTHPYEGGHPDHDACAFAVHAAVRLAADPKPPIYEFTSYHSHYGVFRAGEFLSNSPSPALTFELNAVQRERKARMLQCFTTQRDVLAQFDIRTERFRPAPDYDFSKPPHPGALYYERFNWGMTGTAFRRIASQTARDLEVVNVCV
jgi:N-acetylglucosamine malate deacetylase 2